VSRSRYRRSRSTTCSGDDTSQGPASRRSGSRPWAHAVPRSDLHAAQAGPHPPQGRTSASTAGATTTSSLPTSAAGRSVSASTATTPSRSSATRRPALPASGSLGRPRAPALNLITHALDREATPLSDRAIVGSKPPDRQRLRSIRVSRRGPTEVVFHASRRPRLRSDQQASAHQKSEKRLGDAGLFDSLEMSCKTHTKPTTVVVVVMMMVVLHHVGADVAGI
jgi:hypothetical protein